MLSIITVSHNSSRDLPRFVETFLASGSGHDVAIEFILVENSGSPEIETCVEPLRHAGFRVTFVMVENRGFGAGCNHGAALAQGDVLVFANPDIEFENAIDSVSKIAAGWGTVAQLTGAGEVRSFDILPECKSVFGEFAGRYRRMTPPPARRMNDLVPIGSFFCVDRKLFEEVGGFDDRFFLYHEEAELSGRLQQAVGPPAFLPNVRIVHHSFGSQESKASTLAHEADGLVTYAVVTGKWSVLRTRMLFLLLTAPISSTSRSRLRHLITSRRRRGSKGA